MEPKATSELPGRTTTERVDGPVRDPVRRQNAAAYLAWEAKVHPDGLDELDRATAEMSLTGAEW